MADAHGSGPCAREGVGVQLPPRAPAIPGSDEPGIFVVSATFGVFESIFYE